MDLVVVRGGGDIASGVIHRLFMSGFKVVVLETEKPTAIRRAVSFCEAIYRDEIVIEGVKGVYAKAPESIEAILNAGSIPIFIDEKGEIIKTLRPIAVVDAIIAKRNLGTIREMAPITIGIGPGFHGGIDVDAIIESQRGHNLGKVMYEGEAAENTGLPGIINGFSEERVLRAPCDGIANPLIKIGDYVKEKDVVCVVKDMEVFAGVTGVLRGMIKDGFAVYKGMKIGDIDPRGIREYAFTISDKARAIGGGVLEALMHLYIDIK